MGFTGTIEKGMVKLPPEAAWPDGTLVRVEPVESPEAATALHQRWIDEALASGSATPLTREKFDAAYQRALKRFENQKAAAR
jgi:hypothetical protein